MTTNDWRLEQHVGTIMQVLVVALLGWSLKTSVDMRTEIGVLQAKVESLQSTVSQGTNDRYRSADAARDFASVWSELSRIDNRLTKCEGRR